MGPRVSRARTAAQMEAESPRRLNDFNLGIPPGHFMGGPTEQQIVNFGISLQDQLRERFRIIEDRVDAVHNLALGGRLQGELAATNMKLSTVEIRIEALETRLDSATETIGHQVAFRDKVQSEVLNRMSEWSKSVEGGMADLNNHNAFFQS